jgi:hypothetical protein
MNACSFGQLPTGRGRERITAMPKTDTRVAAVAVAIAATLAIAAPAAARSTLLDDDAPAVRRALAAGLRTSTDNLWGTAGAAEVLGPTREVAAVRAAELDGRTPAAMATVLRAAVARAGGHYAFVDDVGDTLAGADGAALASALATLEKETGGYGAGLTLARRVHLVAAPTAGGILTSPAQAGLRTAIGRSGGLWLKPTGWTAQQWLTWPVEASRQAASRGLAASRVHVMLTPGDQRALWGSARTGSACATLRNGPGAYRLGAGMDAFAQEFRRAFPSKFTFAGCTAAPVLPRPGASALVASAAREATGLEIPPGGLVTPPLVAGEPAQVTLQLGADPLGLAAGLGLDPQAAWEALGVVVQVRGPGVAIDVPIGGDGSAPLTFTPTAPGPVTMRIAFGSPGVQAALGGPADMVASLAATAGGAPFLSRVVAEPDAWSLTIPLAPTGGAVGEPVLVIVPPFG